MPVVEIPFLGRGGAIALIALVHIMFANLALGGPLIAVISEWLGRRQRDDRYDNFAYSLARFNVVGFSVGATLGVGLVALLTGLWPLGWTRILNMYFWPLVLEVLFFFLEGALLYYYVYTWHRRQRRGHLAWGIAAVVAGLGTMLIINGVASAMMTPPPDALNLGGGGPEVLWERFVPLYLWNASWLPLSLHRLVGALSFTGFVVGAVAALANLRARSYERQTHFRWMAGYGLRFGFLPLLAMPAIGFLYVNEIRGPAPMAFVNLMMGEARWAFNAQVGMLALLFVLGNWFMLRQLRAFELTTGGYDVVRQWMLPAGGLALAAGLFLAWTGVSGGLRTAFDNIAIVLLLVLIYLGAIVVLRRVYVSGLKLNEEAVMTANPEAEGRWANWPTASGQSPQSKRPAPVTQTETIQQMEFYEDVNWARYGEVVWLFVLLCGLLLAMPFNQLGLSGFALGQMRPWKFTAMVGLVTLTLPILALYLRGRGEARNLGEPHVSPLLPLASGGLALGIMFVMGYAREAARAPFLVNGLLEAKAEPFETAGNPSTLPLPFEVALPLLLFGMLLFVLLGLMVLQTAHGVEAIEPDELEEPRIEPPAAPAANPS
ncbi:MAG: cytochrome ubiquinol oxidase subunit I [Chloroflexota bacterium]